MKYRKTIETKTDPCIIVTNDLGDYSTGGIIIGQYYYNGDDGEVPPRITLDTEGVIYLDRKELESLIEALKEFL